MSPREFPAARAAATSLAVVLSAGLVMTAVPQEAAFAAGAVQLAAAKPNRPGSVQNLQATATKSDAGYALKATWDALTGAQHYQVTVTNASTGTALAKATVTGPTWTGTTTLPVLSSVKVQVVPVSSTGRKGRPVSTTVSLPDVTPPTAVFHVGPGASEHDVTVTATVSDDSSKPVPAGSIDWADGGPGTPDTQSWDFSGPVTHSYANDGVYHATVHLVDWTGNAADETVAIAVNDTSAPTGAYTTDVSSAWARFTPVSLAQTALSDNFSAPADITRSVDWGDGSTPTDWSGAAAPTHVYQTAGTFTPTVTLTDEAGNTAPPVQAGPVTVAADTAAPRVTVHKPLHPRRVDSWRRVRGTVTDSGVGPAVVRVKVVEKRGAHWFGYHPATKTWTKYRSRTRALTKAGWAKAAPSSTGAWSARLAGLRRGSLVLKAFGRDKLANASHVLTVRQDLTR